MPAVRAPSPAETAARPAWLAAAAWCAVAACGCATRQALEPPQLAPAAFEHGAAIQGKAWPGQDWYRGFGSDELNSLVDFAVANNADLAGARERVLEADAHARQAGAAILPTVSANANGNYLAGRSQQGSGHELDWFAMLSASYEVDFWGKNRATANAALFTAGASRAERDTVALTILGGVADQYFQVLAVRERLTIAHSNRDAARQILEVVEARLAAGAAAPAELAAQQAALDRAEITITDLQQLEMQAHAALALLLGRIPESFPVAGESLDALREPVVSAGLPAELLTRRPDVAAAEDNLQAASANLTAARAAMFPSLTLTAAAGVQNPALPATVLTIPGVGPSVALGANLTQPIFDHGRLAAQRDEAAARERELLAAYRAAIIAALGDVENALGTLEHLDAAREFEQGSLAASERAFEGARLRYQRGAGDFLTLLVSQQGLYAARDQLTQYRLARLQALIALYKALGGGWSAPAARSPAHRTGEPDAVS